MRSGSRSLINHGNSEIKFSAAILVAHARVHSTSVALAHVIRKEPINSRLRICAVEVVLPEVRHAEDSNSVASGTALLTNDVMM